jgi:O-acetyl-ADP-ribose deacetylase (regulator of RNase III)
MVGIEIVRGAVYDQDVDVIVNAANTSMRGGGGVDGAIHREAGPSPLQELEEAAPDGAKTAEVVVTGAHDLPQEKIFHVAGPVWRGGGQGEAEHLGACYRNCLEQLNAARLESIAFCSISTGVYGFPLGSAAEIALGEARRFRRSEETGNVRQIVFALYGQDEYDVFTHQWSEKFGETN